MCVVRLSEGWLLEELGVVKRHATHKPLALGPITALGGGVGDR